jgi:hypothetical protein
MRGALTHDPVAQSLDPTHTRAALHEAAHTVPGKTARGFTQQSCPPQSSSSSHCQSISLGEQAWAQRLAVGLMQHCDPTEQLTVPPQRIPCAGARE